jgi:ribose 5-phosphate isomerase B
MRIAIASDHAGYALKVQLKVMLAELGHEAVDFGTNSEEPVDYPDYILPAARAVATGECERGIVLGGSGNGEAMVANKVPGVRCALCWDVTSARLSREHNDANTLSMGARLVNRELAMEITRVWLETAYEGGRHDRRLAKIKVWEEQTSKTPLRTGQ